MVDRTREDLAQLLRTNRLVAQAQHGASEKPLVNRSGRDYRPVSVMVVSPPADHLGQLAAQSFGRSTSGWRAVRNSDNWLIGRLLRGGGEGAGWRDLLSYLLFDPGYFDEAISLGRRCALDTIAGGWQR